MKSLRLLGALLIASVVSSVSFSAMAASNAAGTGLVIHTAEFGVGKFHRADHQAHAYAKGHSWSPFILAQGARTDKPLVQKNDDGSYTVFFLTLEDMFASVQQIAKSENKPVSVLNIHGHGLPGRMWFPKDQITMKGWQCGDWREAASGSDQANYEQYYSPVSASQVQQIRDISNNPNVGMPCTTGLTEWQEVLAKAPEFKTVLASDIQIHFLSCVVGLGTVGEAFTTGIANLLLTSPAGRVETSVNFGLGDWSMFAGMGFWDYLSDSQIQHDGEVYSKNRTDSEIAQKGTIRVAVYAGKWSTNLRANVDFMSLQYQPAVAGVVIPDYTASLIVPPAPAQVRVPGTGAFINVEQ